MTRHRQQNLATVMLLLVTAVFGSTFFLIKDLVKVVPPTDFLAIRFTIAGVVMLVVFWRHIRALTRRDVFTSLVLGVLYGVAQVLQTVGLAHTAASVSGFITGFYVVLTPIFAGLLLRDRIRPMVWLAVALAVTGLAILSLQGRLGLGYGELLTLGCAALYALHIVGLGRWSSERAASGMSAVQIWVIAVIGWISALSDGRITTPQTAGQWTSLLYMALCAGVFVLWAQTWAQARMTATRAAITLTFEPVFAAAFAVLFGGESATWRMLVGGALVLAAMFVVEAGATRSSTDPPAEVLHHEAG